MDIFEICKTLAQPPAIVAGFHSKPHFTFEEADELAVELQALEPSDTPDEWKTYRLTDSQAS
jgi:hypothetical protein